MVVGKENERRKPFERISVKTQEGRASKYHQLKWGRGKTTKKGMTREKKKHDGTKNAYL